MSPSMTPELHYATLAATFTGLIWLPIIANRLLEIGPWRALKNPEPDVRPRADWSHRAGHAHRNAIENLVVFAPLAIGIHVLGVGDDLTAAWSQAFFWSRATHAVVYTLGAPLVRTIAFFIGFLAQMTLAARLLGLV
ncbi:MAG: MAPEG family protein [Hyphomonadaceae bacterium]|nr:MAPEG family protein [Hyphomonadaceae bacterium]